MAKSLLNGVNDVLKRVNIITGDSGELSSLTNSGKQTFIDLAVQVWNEAIDELYTTAETPKPNELAESTFTLSTGIREYTLASDLVQLRFPLQDETNGRYISEYPGGYTDLVADQDIPGNYTGQPHYAAIRETDGKLYVDREPTSNENGQVYKYRYDKELALTVAGSTVPFKDMVYRAMVPAVAELWKRNQRNSFDEAYYRLSIGRAARLLTQKQQRDSWVPRRSYVVSFDPYAD